MLLPLMRVILGQAAGQKRMGRAMVFIAIPGQPDPGTRAGLRRAGRLGPGSVVAILPALVLPRRP
jgi:hypothetical protein